MPINWSWLGFYRDTVNRNFLPVVNLVMPLPVSERRVSSLLAWKKTEFKWTKSLFPLSLVCNVKSVMVSARNESENDSNNATHFRVKRKGLECNQLKSYPLSNIFWPWLILNLCLRRSNLNFIVAIETTNLTNQWPWNWQ